MQADSLEEMEKKMQAKKKHLQEQKEAKARAAEIDPFPQSGPLFRQFKQGGLPPGGPTDHSHYPAPERCLIDIVNGILKACSAYFFDLPCWQFLSLFKYLRYSSRFCFAAWGSQEV